MAQRIMDKADAGQILVGHAVYDVLKQREKYFTCFRAYTASGKHGLNFNVYQFLSKDAKGLSETIPSAFAAKKANPVAPAKLTKLAAYYMAHAEKHREFLIVRRSDPGREYAATILLTYLAEDSKTTSETPLHEEADTKTWDAGEKSFEEQYAHYFAVDFWVMADLANLLVNKHLAPYSEYFERSEPYGANYCFVNQSGIKKLQNEWPDIMNELKIKPRVT